MAQRRNTSNQRRQPPATTPEGRERQIVAAAYDLAEQQIQNGEASSQVITHFLKLGSTREHLEQLRMEEEIKLMKAKAELLETQKNMESLIGDALEAFKSYSGTPPDKAFDD